MSQHRKTGGFFRRLTQDGTSLLAVLFLGMAGAVAGMAPFLSEDRPLWMRDRGELTFPLFRSMSDEDLFWFTPVAALLCGYIIWRVGSWMSLRRGRTLSLLAMTAVLLIGWSLAATRDSFNDPRRYRSELEARGRIASLDKNPSRDAYLDLMSTCPVTMFDELDGRILLLQKGGGNSTDFVSLARENRNHLMDLEEAFFPLNRFRPDIPDGFHRFLRPGESKRHAMGTDATGRDVVALMIHGARNSISIAVAAMAIATLLGIIVGSAAGYFGGTMDRILSRLIEIFMCLPVLFVLFLLMAYVPSGRLPLIMVLGLVMWTHPARLVRAEARRIAGEDYVLAARALGASPLHIISRHVIPNAISPILVSATLGIGTAILAESSLAFLGLGNSNSASWGRMLREGREAGMAENWHLVVLPGVAVFLTVLACNFIGDRVRDVLDPRTS